MEPELRQYFEIDSHLTLRTFTEDDADEIFATAIQNRDHLQPFMRWMKPDFSLDSSKEFITRSSVGSEERKSLGFGIFRDNKLIGTIGFVYFDWEARKTEIGYWLIKSEEGKGVVFAACKTLIRYAFDELGLKRVEIRCAVENLRSARVPERLGFTKEGVLRQAEILHGKLHDFNIYGLLAEDTRLW